MNSLFPFLWRRDEPKLDSRGVVGRSTSEALSSMPPLVAASKSCDTFGENDDAEQIKITLTRLPTTPEGLRPRRANTFVRRDLGLSDHNWELPNRPPAISQLPPRLSASWSTQGVLSSGSSGGPFSRAHSGSHGVAQSPHLIPGHARTAVGALVAMNVAPEQNPQSTEEMYRWTPDWGFVENPPRNDEASPDLANEYYALNDTVQNESRLPVPDPSTNQSFVDSPISKASSLAASPSSRAHLFYHGREKTKMSENTNVNTSYSSQVRLIHAANTSFASRALQMNSETMGAYDFTPLVDGQELILSSLDHFTNMSAMSQSALDQESQLFEPETSLSMMNEDFFPSSQYANLDHALRKSKSENQRHAKEELILSSIQRLQDNVDLVTEVQARGGLQAGMDSCKHYDHEGLLTGFSEDSRATIATILEQLAEEMDHAATDENETHHDLRDSILFCKKLVTNAMPQSGVPEHLRGTWRIHDHVKNCLGMVHPETPDVVRGGDTSVFSLPSGCDETPMTSNVSLTTTITSAVTTPNGRKNGKMKPFVDGLVLRRTIDIFCTLLEKLTQSCHTLLDKWGTSKQWHAGSEVSIRVTEEIKRTYLQLLAMEIADLHSLVDCFVYHASPLAIPYEDDKLFEVDQRPNGFVLPSLDSYRRMVTLKEEGVPERDLFSPSTEDMRTLPNGYATDEDSAEEEEDDDLRRQTGSQDHDDEDAGTREGPPPANTAPGTPSIHPSLMKMGLTSPSSI
ncbi:hypothetical protein FisN_30Hh014 [Fistulifera solaris]|uniref:Uncharacterized protein n=1 Tax=Fistulifera solaris TaxID=1519565 RepID=A0A1Z5K6J0_FISSO|nr:hypothetical protein FisN_30Hh014 [Fistulifera solaris]|eukprot:GAX21815.1 hypothetical protein FisN_30Hh014 [Fistulifera solaris]